MSLAYWEKIILYLPTQKQPGDVAQLARALAWHARGRGFDSHLLHKKPQQKCCGFFVVAIRRSFNKEAVRVERSGYRKAVS